MLTRVHQTVISVEPFAPLPRKSPFSLPPDALLILASHAVSVSVSISFVTLEDASRMRSPAFGRKSRLYFPAVKPETLEKTAPLLLLTLMIHSDLSR